MDMPKPESSDKGERIISGKPEGSNKVPSGTKVFSSFQVGKQHPKEKQYLAFTKFIYNLPEESGETFEVLGTTSLFSRISIFPNGSPGFTTQLFESDLNELSELPKQLVNSVKTYAQGEGVYCRFFSIFMKCKDLQVYFPTINYITIEKLKDFNIKASGDFKVLDYDHDWVLMTKGRSKMEATEETWKLACKMLDHKHELLQEDE
ncbi:hypothetical protein H5410_013289 [Solanum commersonii]|uniref:Uncharacterized protein n=1 Tax=Solanum commersonii TaxID=4109 RepID=A0A9J6AVA7_SOLCO|nr:hypothetical protein H5410_013289 [Solanum commersonii]